MKSVDERKQELRALRLALADEPISTEDRRYFDFYSARGEPRGSDPIADLRATIESSENGDGATTCQLFSGFRGTGKSTELKRLAKELASAGFVVLTVNGGEVLNLHQLLEPADLLIGVAADVADIVAKDAGKSPAARSLGERIHELFVNTDVDLTEVALGLGATVGNPALGGAATIDVAKLKLQLTKNPSFKLRVQKAFRNRFAKLSEDFQRFMDVARAAIVEGAGRSPVLLVDDLEKIRGTGADQDIIQKGMEQIFWQFDKALHIDGWHTVWTVPPYLPLVNGDVANLYDGSFVLPMVRLWEQDDARTPDPDGIAAMRRCLRKRGGVDDLFLHEELFDRVIVASSGHLRDLLRLMQDAVREVFKQKDPNAPLNEVLVWRLIGDYERGCQQSVYNDDLPWLATVAKERRIRLPNQEMVARASKLLDTAVVMNYRNGGEWVDVCSPVQKLLG